LPDDDRSALDVEIVDLVRADLRTTNAREREGGCARRSNEPSPPKARLDCAGRYACFIRCTCELELPERAEACGPRSGEPASI